MVQFKNIVRERLQTWVTLFPDLEPYMIVLCGPLLEDSLYLHSYFYIYITFSGDLKQHTRQLRSGLSSCLALDITTS